MKRLPWITFAAWLSGCTPHPPYRPVVPHRGSASGVEVEIVEVPSSRSGAVLTVKAPPETEIVRGLLVTSKASPCREGIRDIGLAIDDQGKWLRPVPIDGVHNVKLQFPADAALSILEDSSAIDLVLKRGGEEICVRTPFAGAAPELAWQKRPVASGGAAFHLHYPSRPVGSVANGWSFEYQFGGIVGPARWMGSFGFGAANCKGDCPASDGSSGFFWLPFRASVDTYLFETRGFGIAAEAGYQLLPALRSRRDEKTTRTETSHGPRLALRFALTQMAQPGWPGGARFGSLGLELFVAEWLAASNASDRAFVWGFGVVTDYGD